MSPTAAQAGNHDCTECTHCTQFMAVIGCVTVEWGIAVQTTSGEGDRHPYFIPINDSPRLVIFHKSGNQIFLFKSNFVMAVTELTMSGQIGQKQL